MTKSRFAQLLFEMGEELDISLEPDVQNACTILFDEKIPIQLEMDPHKNALIMACIVGTIPPGKFREKVLSYGLKANALYPRPGVFAYRENNNELILFHSLPMDNLTGKKTAEYLGLFTELAQEWRKSIETGDFIPVAKEKQTSYDPFNLKK